ncbi:hypothetical protein THOG05_190055 [Vibrio rotiferianus]|nr:hypothetical protein THOG05_190055 [Vibrio rotiferianus]
MPVHVLIHLIYLNISNFLDCTESSSYHPACVKYLCRLLML